MKSMSEEFGQQPQQQNDYEQQVLPSDSTTMQELESLFLPGEEKLRIVDVLMGGDISSARELLDSRRSREPQVMSLVLDLLANCTQEVAQSTLAHEGVRHLLDTPNLYTLSPRYEQNIKPKLEQVTQKIAELRAKYPQLVGVSFYGSLHKGYFIEGKSDLDGKVILDTPDNNSELSDLIKQEFLPFLFSLFPGEEDVAVTDFGTPPRFAVKPRTDSCLWQGLFVGSVDHLVKTRDKLYPAWQNQNTVILVGTLVSQGYAIEKIFERSEQIFGEKIELTEDQLKFLKALLVLKRMPNIEERLS